MPTAIFCADCGSTGTIAKVTAGLQCRCGSTNLGLDGVDPKPSVAVKQAYDESHGQSPGCPVCGEATEPHNSQRYTWPDGHTDRIHLGRCLDDFHADNDPKPKRAAKTAAPHGPGSGWFKPMPDTLDGWDQYVGPEASPNPERVRDNTRWPCPECQGSGYDLIDKTHCKACKGTGKHMPPTSAPAVQSYDPHAPQHPGGAGWHGATLSTAPSVSVAPSRIVTGGPERPRTGSGVQPPAAKAPNGSRGKSAASTAPAGTPVYPMPALCPECTMSTTHLAADRSGHAWWCCHTCGSLADLDRTPTLDPFDPPPSFKRDGSMRIKASRLRKAPYDGKLLRLIAAVHAQNAVTPQEALTLARASLAKYPG